jgi:hypothetical protein
MARWKRGWFAIVRGSVQGSVQCVAGAFALCGVLGGGPALAGESGPGESGSGEKLELSAYDLGRLAELEQQSANGGQEAAPPVLAGFDSKQGFFLKDAAGDNVLQTAGSVQVRYVYKSRENAADDSFVELERARFILKGNVLTPDLTYYFQIDGDSDDSGSVDVLDYYFEYKFAEGFNAGAGQHKTYFLRQEKTSSSRLQFVDRSLANEVFNIDRNLGLWVHGDLGPVFYAVEVGNGFGSINRDPDEVDQIPHVAAKLDFNIFGEHTYEEGGVKGGDSAWVIGGSFAADKNNGSSDVDGVEFSAVTFGLDTALRAAGFSLAAEYMGRWLDLDDDGDGTDYAHGFYAQVGYCFGQSFEIAGRVSAVYGDGENDGTGVEAGPGVTWYISKSHKVKWQTDVLYFDIPDDLPTETADLIDDALPFSSFASSSANLESDEEGVMLRTQFQLSFG